METYAWIIPYCPNFYFLPSLSYHQVFKEWDNGSWKCPAYWNDIGLPLIPCYATEDEAIANCWITRDKWGKWSNEVYLKEFNTLPMWTEALNASRHVQEFTQLLTCDLFSPIERGRIAGPPPIFKDHRRTL